MSTGPIDPISERADAQRSLAQLGALALVATALVAPLWRCGNERATLPLPSPVPPANASASAVPPPLSPAACATGDAEDPQEPPTWSDENDLLTKRKAPRRVAHKPRRRPPALTLTPAIAPALVPAAELVAMLPDDGIAHSRFGLAVGTFPGTLALDIQLVRTRLSDLCRHLPEVETSLDAIGNSSMLGMQLAFGGQIYAGVGAFRDTAGATGVALTAGSRF